MRDIGGSTTLVQKYGSKILNCLLSNYTQVLISTVLAYLHVQDGFPNEQFKRTLRSIVESGHLSREWGETARGAPKNPDWKASSKIIFQSMCSFSQVNNYFCSTT